MEHTTDPIDKILETHGMEGPWGPLHATGVANRIYATQDVVIRISNQHEEALLDAKTEAIAAPVVIIGRFLEKIRTIDHFECLQQPQVNRKFQ